MGVDVAGLVGGSDGSDESAFVGVDETGADVSGAGVKKSFAGSWVAGTGAGVGEITVGLTEGIADRMLFLVGLAVG